MAGDSVRRGSRRTPDASPTLRRQRPGSAVGSMQDYLSGYKGARVEAEISHLACSQQERPKKTGAGQVLARLDRRFWRTLLPHAVSGRTRIAPPARRMARCAGSRWLRLSARIPGPQWHRWRQTCGDPTGRAARGRRTRRPTTTRSWVPGHSASW